MVNVNYSADVEHLDEPLSEAEKERPDQPIRLRLQPSILRTTGRTDGPKTEHRNWPGVSWFLDCTDVAEAVAVREALVAFFEALEVAGPVAVRERLTVTAWLSQPEAIPDV